MSMAQAVAVVDAAGSAGGIDEVVALARHGWPSDRKLEGCAANDVRRAAIAELARQMVDEMSGWSGDPRQHESVMRARWGGSFVPEAFAMACERLGS